MGGTNAKESPKRFAPSQVPIGLAAESLDPTQSIKPPVEEETITENISSAGCYFILSEEPKVGSRVDMEVQMAPKPGGKPNSKMFCRGRVVRIQKEKGNGKTGVGCAIDRYRIVPTAKIS